MTDDDTADIHSVRATIGFLLPPCLSPHDAAAVHKTECRSDSCSGARKKRFEREDDDFCICCAVLLLLGARNDGCIMALDF